MSMNDGDYAGKLAALQRQGQAFATVNTVLLVILSLWVFADLLYLPAKTLGAELYKGEDVGAALLAFARTVGYAMPAISLLFGLRAARVLFERIAAGEPFAPDCGKALENLGTWVIGAAVTALVLGDTAALSGMAPVLLAIGFLLDLFGRAFALAAVIKADNDGIV